MTTKAARPDVQADTCAPGADQRRSLNMIQFRGTRAARSPNLALFARRGRAIGQRTYCPCSVCSEPEAHPLQAVRGLAAALSQANATGNPGGLEFARRLGRSPLDGHCGPAAPRRLPFTWPTHASAP